MYLLLEFRYEVKQLNIRNKPGKPSKIVGNSEYSVKKCLYLSVCNGKWGKTDRGWMSRKYLTKDDVKNNFLLADIDHDGKNEKLTWECFSGCSDGYAVKTL